VSASARARTGTVPSVPFLDLAPTHGPLKAAILDDVARLIDSGRFTNGPEVAQFEDVFAEYCGTRHCVGVANGLDALRLGLIAAGVEPGDEIAVPANTFVATFEAVSQAGAIPVPVDVTEVDYDLDVDALATAIGSRTRGIVPVHLYGQLADMRAIRAVAERHGLLVLEDACQAHGAERDGERAGSASLAAAFSFYPGKNLGAMGDAGALVTDDANVAAAVRSLREHGQRRKYLHEVEGYTSRLDTIQAIALRHKLPLLDGWNESRRSAASFYNDALAGVGDLRLPAVASGSAPVWHLYVVRTADPETLAAFLRQRGVATGRHYPQPAHLSGAYAHLGYRPGAFPVTERLANEVLSLPMYPGIAEGQLGAVVEAITKFFHG